jgi:hypothetical protein
METPGSLIDKLNTVDFKMWDAQNNLYSIRKMTFEEFYREFGTYQSMKKLYDIFKKSCDLNYQRSELITEIDKLIVVMIQDGIDGCSLDKYVKLAHKTY